jgi:O-acetyl-ADP-ribose deacetylase (regulator of RNase III)
MRGDMFAMNPDVYINTVNCVGVMGKGIALEFKRRFPVMFEKYRMACQNKQVVPGKMLVYVLPMGDVIVNFPTKRHWKDNSRLEDIEAGLDDLLTYLKGVEKYHPAAVVAIPALGCGNGGLDWRIVKDKIVQKLQGLTLKILIFEPGGAFNGKATVVE